MASKQIISESVSSVVYHYCNLSTLVAIVERNEIVLSCANLNKIDKKLNNNYLFYLSFTRQKTNKVGYANSKGYRGVNLNVRITFDGDILNYNHAGRPVDFMYQTLANSPIRATAYEIYGEKAFSHKMASESEDRLLSNIPVISDVRKYIKRIDILLPTEFQTTQNISQVISVLKSEQYQDIINVYQNENSFNLQKDDIINDCIKRTQQIIPKGNNALTPQQNKVIVTILQYIALGETEIDIEKLLRDYNLNSYEHQITKLYNTKMLLNQFAVNNIENYLSLQKIYFYGNNHYCFAMLYYMIYHYTKAKEMQNGWSNKEIVRFKKKCLNESANSALDKRIDKIIKEELACLTNKMRGSHLPLL